MLKGFRTLLVGLAIAIGPEALNYLAGVDWKLYIPPDYIPIITGVIMVGLRLVTSTAVLKKGT